ncbi:MAG: PH domain-containing protein [Planctomycetota bacterium]
MLLLSFLDAVRATLLLGLLALVGGFLWLAGLMITLFVANMAYAIARFVTFRYRLTENELITTEGILHRQERRIPINRVQDLSFEQSLLRRFLGLVVVSIETASGESAEAKLDSLGRPQAVALREVVMQQRERLLGPSSDATHGPSEYVLHRSTAAELALRGLTNNRLGVILATVFGLWELLREFGLAETLVGVTIDRLSGFGTFGIVLALAGFVVLAVVAGWVVSLTTSFLLYFHFVLTRRGEVFQRRYGLITTRVRSLPRRKIQRVIVEQTWLRRLLEVAVVRADSAGATAGQKDEREAGGPNVVVPLAQPRKIAPLLPLLLPGLERENPTWQRAPRSVVVRCTLSGLINALLLAAILWYWLGSWSLVTLVLVPVGWAEGMLLLQNLAFGLGREHVVLRYGALGRYQAFVPLRKVQGVTLTAGPVDRLLGLAQLTVWVAGGSPSAMRDLPIGFAKRAKELIARQAAVRRFVW